MVDGMVDRTADTKGMKTAAWKECLSAGRKAGQWVRWSVVGMVAVTADQRAVRTVVRMVVSSVV